MLDQEGSDGSRAQLLEHGQRLVDGAEVVSGRSAPALEMVEVSMHARYRRRGSSR